MKENKKKQIKIELKEEVAQGHYVNLPIVGFSQAEFILDFIKVIPGIPKADVKSRLIMSPMHTKNLLLLLNAKIKEYEKKFGKIQAPKKEIESQNIKLPDDVLPN
ncbi:MAG: hypothetical protein CMG54_01145 [Candidatus Marinimicrobia bacterium]|nr:hypothetical protein [Candidatus Neomarinimicrobiota bacterium]|tara:strand:+ start:1431 stop:1745 length:315 start_codon:yes stop_codon:yes gene_type:complete